MEAPLVSVVIPACDEEACVEATVREVFAALPGERVEVIVVDDGSRDGTWAVVERLAAAFGGLGAEPPPFGGVSPHGTVDGLRPASEPDGGLGAEPPPFGGVSPHGTADGLRPASEPDGGLGAELRPFRSGSPQGTGAGLGPASEPVYPRLRGVRLARNFGHMAALQAGLHEAQGAAVITMDADGQHPATALPAMLAAWRGGAAVVQAVRIAEARRGLFKGYTSGLYYRLFSRLAGIELKEGAADFRLLSRQVVDVALAHPHFALFLRGFVSWTGFRTASLPVAFRARSAGTTKYSLRKMLALGAEGVLRFSTKPLRAATYLGLATCALSLTYLVYVVVIRLFGHDFVAGWASVAGLMALIGGIQLLVVGILGEYVAVVFERQIGRPDYVVAEKKN